MYFLDFLLPREKDRYIENYKERKEKRKEVGIREVGIRAKERRGEEMRGEERRRYEMRGEDSGPSKGGVIKTNLQ